MPSIIRLGDADSAGHPMAVGSANTFVNNRPVCRLGDIDAEEHANTPGGGNRSTLYINNIPVSVSGDIDTSEDQDSEISDSNAYAY